MYQALGIQKKVKRTNMLVCAGATVYVLDHIVERISVSLTL